MKMIEAIIALRVDRTSKSGKIECAMSSKERTDKPVVVQTGMP